MSTDDVSVTQVSDRGRIGKGLIVLVLSILATLLLLRWFDVATFRSLFALRVPIVTGLVLFFLPAIALYALPSMLANVFVLNNKWRLTTVIVAASIAGLGILFVGGIIAQNGPCRFQIGTCNPTGIMDYDAIWPYIWGIILGLPVSLASIFLSSEIKRQDKWIGAILGFGVMLALMVGIYQLRQLDTTFLDKLLVGLLYLLPAEARVGFIDAGTGQLGAGIVVATSFVLVVGGIYALGYFLFRPSPDKKKFQAPTLYYILVLTLAGALLMGSATFFLDYYRIPTLLLALVISFAVYRFYGVDHFFVIRQRGETAPAPSVAQALEARLKHQGEARTLVVVCASGGGIQAAGWAAQVLTGLQTMLGEEFTRAIGLLSTISGGSVGAMYYLDRFGAQGYPEGDDLDKIFAGATADSLDATGWGFAYPDLWRLAGLPFLPPRLQDRGSAIEADWKRVMRDRAATVLGWRKDLAEGRLPIPVLNATQVESGRRLLLTPVTFSNCEAIERIDFDTLFPERDLDVSTAARLSATFSYVSPICRDSENYQGFHVADGGYFDNYGVFTAVEWLKHEVMPLQRQLGIKRVIFVEIHAFASDDDSAGGERQKIKPTGWLMAILGPLLTLLSVRTSTQAVRDAYDVKTLEGWDDPDTFKHFTITFPKDIPFFETSLPATGHPKLDAMAGRLKRKVYQPPLSWKLTKKQKQAIQRGWKQLEKEQDGVLQQLRQLWEKRPGR